MEVSEQGVALIKKFEGFSAEPYFCPAGKQTIGYGHAIRTGDAIAGRSISQEEAEALLAEDIDVVEKALHELIKVPLLQHQLDALVSFVYNVGVEAFSHSTLLRLINEGNTVAAPEQFLRWVYSNGKRLSGLEKRREAEKLLFINQI